ncbi:MAG: hypothetical protein ACP5XB_07315 [Isosphaeraceae bacterium]
MIARLRQILPHRLTMVFFAALFLLLEGPVLYVEWKMGLRVPGLKVRPGTMIILFAAAFYGFHRAVVPHPFYRADYRKWLEMTPWTVHKPLPMGPVSLVLEDSLILGILMLLTWTQPVRLSIRVLNTFLISHSLFLTAAFWSTGVGTLGYLALFGLGLAVRFWYSPWVCFALATAVYLVVHEGLWQSLARFPWKLEREWYDAFLERERYDAFNDRARADKLVGPSCGWPYDRLLRDVKSAEKYRLGSLDAVLISMLAGWWVSCLVALVFDPSARVDMGDFAFTLCLIFAPLVRLLAFVKYYRSPISFWGRIRTWRWIIPGYDRCLVGPALAVVAAGSVFGLCQEASVSLEIASSLGITTVLLVTLTTPPGLREWRLTGKHRMVPGP